MFSLHGRLGLFIVMYLLYIGSMTELGSIMVTYLLYVGPLVNVLVCLNIQMVLYRQIMHIKHPRL